MVKQLRVLNVEDSADDALLLLRQLAKAGYEVTFERVDNARAMKAALDSREWDVVITDYVLPNFSGPAAIALSRDRQPDLPVILLSGVVQDEWLEAEALKQGARDYLEKANLGKLVAAIGLAAGVLEGRESAEAHLMLCRQYLELGETSLIKAIAHGESAVSEASRTEDEVLEADALLWLGVAYQRSGDAAKAIATLQRFLAVQQAAGREQTVTCAEAYAQLGQAFLEVGDRPGALDALQRATAVYTTLDLPSRAAACQRLLARITQAEDPAGSGAAALPEDAAEQALERAKYYLMMDDTARAAQEAIEALRLTEGDALRSHHGYMLLCRTARREGHTQDALGFALSARIMALEAKQEEMAYRATAAFLELLASQGDQGSVMLRAVADEYRHWGIDIRTYLPPGIHL